MSCERESGWAMSNVRIVCEEEWMENVSCVREDGLVMSVVC